MDFDTHDPNSFSIEASSTPLLTLLKSLLLLTLIPPMYIIVNDYTAFTSLGPGGTPSTPYGYLKIRFLSLFALRDPYAPAFVHPHFTPGVLSALPKRGAPRPRVAGIAPHRQTTQRITPGMYALFSDVLKSLAKDPANHLVQGTSCFEKHGTGLFSLAPIVRTCRGEVCHLHPSDGSMHLSLHPADAKIVLEAGWGERHPLAQGGWMRRFVPREFMMVYAPREEEDVRVLVEIVSAAAWWVSGRKIGGRDDENGRGENRNRLTERPANV
ncbi:hypothetical protein EJ05DRAFT_482382 [Pseudovirgaria hyperparasitica]|uniref:Luciferase domain-containing protein n=1 Tax=Pseudovirgaria hyperparasitica TaxID=470096 RepID=A0A6A6WHD6_9PEZI|nr:uncharacterized protein EJ05DRAFT_482382 [Pseudovirgaria hyperparasitica]KAF2761505.1 hypothetical protein EJ05DRAFT_482382 [Pseudovirgaria hyperparasitica]